MGLCFVSTLNVNGHKFDPQAHSCVFLQTSSFKKGYEVLNLSTSQISISRDVVFHEHIFPFSIPKLTNVISSGIYFPSTTNSDFDFNTTENNTTNTPLVNIEFSQTSPLSHDTNTTDTIVPESLISESNLVDVSTDVPT